MDQSENKPEECKEGVVNSNVCPNVKIGWEEELCAKGSCEVCKESFIFFFE
jgi:hypothetical protein